MLPIEEFRKLSPYRQFHEDCLERYSHNLPPTNGRIRDVYLAAAKRADDNGGSWTVYFITGTTTRPITVGGTVFIDGVQKYAEIKIAANVPVMMRSNKRPVGEHHAMDVSALLFQTQNPDQQHVPILDLVNKDGSRAHLASTGSSKAGGLLSAALAEIRKLKIHGDQNSRQCQGDGAVQQTVRRRTLRHGFNRFDVPDPVSR